MNQLSDLVLNQYFVLDCPEVMAQLFQRGEKHRQGGQVLFAPAA